MKFGVICYRRPVRPGSGVNINIGDSIQELAVLNLYKNMGILDKDICFIDRYHMGSYDGEYVILPMCSFNQISNMYDYEYDSLPPSNKIIPVYISFHLHTRVLDKKLIEHLKIYQPIGCRDEETMINLRNHGIMAYLSGCITTTFPLRKQKPLKDKGKIFFIDTPNSLTDYIPKNIKDDEIEFLPHMPSYDRLSDEHYLTSEEIDDILNIAKKRLVKYADEAKLIITSRLHAATPCMAMGIPVIVVRENIDGRFSWLDKFLPIYSADSFGSIDWNPKSVEYEEFKHKLINLFSKLIMNKYNQVSERYIVSEFYEKRNKSNYNNMLMRLLSKQKFMKYAVWGLTPNTEKIINIITDEFPNAKLKKVIDRYVIGEFYGKKIESPETVVDSDIDIFYIVTAKAAHSDAKDILNISGHKYILI